MHRPYVTCAVFLFACAAHGVGAQQSSPASNPATNPSANQNQYQGQSNPPADAINVGEPEQQPAAQVKPPAGHREKQTAQPVQPAQAPPPARPSSTDSSLNFPNPEDADSGIVQVAPDPEPAPANEPKLQKRSTYNDPDGDIVHPEPLPPGVLAEGTTIRARLLTHLSTTDSRVGETFRARVASDVLQNGNVVIPAGAEITGQVVDVSSGSLGGHGSMRLRPDTVTLPDGSHFRMDAQVTGTPGSRTRVNNEGTINPGSRAKKDGIEYGGAVGVGAVTGAAMGGPAGALAGTIIGASVITVHLLMDHPQAVMEPGTVLMFSLNQRMSLVSTDEASADKASNEKRVPDSASNEQ